MTAAKKALNSLHARMVFNRRVQVLSERLAGHMDGGSVLDVGCGDGTIARTIEGLNPRLAFTGIDVFLRPSVAIPATTYDGKTIPFADETFDWVTIVDVLHHTDDPAATLGECARVARRGVVIKDHLKEGFLAASTLRFMDWIGNRGHDVRLPYNYLSKKEWDGVFRKVGLRPERWDASLHLYPQPFSTLFDRSLHFVATVTRA